MTSTTPVAEIHWVAEAGLKGGVLVPGIPPGSDKDPLYSSNYDPIWRACEQLGLVVNCNSGAGVPEYVDDPVARAILLKEVTWFANRNLAHLIYGGVFERHPHLKVAFTEQGSAWVVNELATLDSTLLVMDEDKSAQHFFGGDEMVHRLRKLPSEYFARNCSWMETAERGGWCSTSYSGAPRISAGHHLQEAAPRIPASSAAGRHGGLRSTW